MPNFSEKKIKILLCLAALCSIGLYCALSYFIFPIADDMDYAKQGMDSLWYHYKTNYLMWCGRYTSNFFVLLNGFVTPNLLFYRLYPVVLIFLILLGVYLLAKKINEYSGENLPVVLFSVMFVSLYLNMMPQTAEGLYWFTGSVTYVLPAFLLLLYTLFIVMYFKNSFIIHKHIHLFLLIFCIVLIVGFNEVLMLLFTCIHVALFLFVRKSKIVDKKIVLMLIIFCIGSASILVLTHGNVNRSEFFPDRHQFFKSLLNTCVQTIRFLSKWIFSLPLWLFSLLYIPFAKKMNSFFNIKKLTSLNLLFVICCLLFIVVCAIFPPFWATGMLGQLRTLNTVLIVFLMAWIVFLHYITQKYITVDEIRVLNASKAKFILSAFLVVSLLLTGNGGIAVYDMLSGKAKVFKSQLALRDEILKKAKEDGNASVEVSLLSEKPASIYVLDLSPDSLHWINYNCAAYYGLKSVRGK